jgi:hypothetical protein
VQRQGGDDGFRTRKESMQLEVLTEIRPVFLNKNSLCKPLVNFRFQKR